jgi:hypothetical protein
MRKNLAGPSGPEATFGPVTRLRPLSESECYTRLYGDRDSTVEVIRELERERPSGGLLGEQLLRLFEKHRQESSEGDLSEVEAA